MLDKSIPWHSIIMMRECHKKVQLPKLMDEYSVRPYRDLKDEIAWAKIETAVGEFDSVEEAIVCHKNYLGQVEELKKRQWFVVNRDDEPVATATCWLDKERKLSCVHAMACLPEYQGKGLGYAVGAYMVQAAMELKPDYPIWLDTQTWSWKAIGLYLKLGFSPMRNAVYNETPNDYELSLPLLRQKLSSKTYQDFVDRTI